MTRFLLLSRWWEFICELAKVFTASHRQVINGEDTLSITTNHALSKGDRIVWQDKYDWHEHVVNELDQEHSGSEAFNFVCEGSHIWDLRLSHIHLAVWNRVTAEYALTEILKLTTWGVGDVEDFGTASIKLENTTVYEALLKIAGTWGCEIAPVIKVTSDGIVSRKISLVHKRGTDRGCRFEYGYNMSGVRKRVLSSDVYTAVYAYGKTLDTKTDGVTDRLTFASINGGKPYVEDTQAMNLWGLPDGRGGMMHSFGVLDDYQIETERELLEKAKDYLAKHSTPEVSYEVTVSLPALADVSLGDTVQVTDLTFTPEVRLEARIGELVRYPLEDKTGRCVFGTVVSVVPDVYARSFKAAQDYFNQNFEYEDSYAKASGDDVWNKVTDNGRTQGVTKVGDNMYINADYINAGTFTVGLLFTANKTAKTVTLAGFSVKENQLIGDAVRLDKKKLVIQSETDNFDIGEVGAGFVDGGGTQYRFVRLNASGNTRVGGISFDDNGSMVGCYTARRVGGQAGNTWSFYKPMDLHGNQLQNASIPSASTVAIGNSIQDSVSFMAPTKINDDGTVAEYAPVSLEYTNGILTNMTKPKE